MLLFCISKIDAGLLELVSDLTANLPLKILDFPRSSHTSEIFYIESVLMLFFYERLLTTVYTMSQFLWMLSHYIVEFFLGISGCKD